MKKSVMTAICAATLLAGMTAYANEYPITHPFYAPDKGQFKSSTTYTHYDAKMKSTAAKRLYGNPKVDVIAEDIELGITDKLVFIGGYYHSAYDYKGVVDDTYKDKYWYLGLQQKFVDDGKTFFSGYFDYCQDNDDRADKLSKGFDLSLTYGKKLDWADPYISGTYTNTLNNGSNNDGFGTIEAGVYKQINDKLGFNAGVGCFLYTDVSKEKYWGGQVDLRYAFTEKTALKLGYSFQLSDSQHKINEISHKTKSLNGFFANLIFVF